MNEKDRYYLENVKYLPEKLPVDQKLKILERTQEAEDYQAVWLVFPLLRHQWRRRFPSRDARQGQCNSR